MQDAGLLVPAAGLPLLCKRSLGVKSRARVQCTLLLLIASCLLPETSAGIVGEAVANGLGHPFLRFVRGVGGINETTGTEPFLQAFINGQIVPYVQSCHVLLPDGTPDCDKIEGDCAETPEACGYIYTIEALVASGAVLGILLVAAFLSCCVMDCCCPARDPPVEWNAGSVESSSLVAKARRSSMYAVPVLAGVVTVATAIGFLIILELHGDVLHLLRGVRDGTAVPGEVQARADWALLRLSVLQEEFLKAKAALRLTPAEGLAELRNEVDAMRGALAAVAANASALQQFVEGCTTGATHCGGPGSAWNLCTYTSPDAKGFHSIGTGVTLSSGATSPACRDPVTGALHACPCCDACHRLEWMIGEGTTALPNEEDVNALNTTLPPEEVLAAATQTVDYYRPSIASVVQSVGAVNDSMREAEAEVW
jgi:hypothetical protein